MERNYTPILLVFLLLVTACATNEQKRITLASLDSELRNENLTSSSKTVIHKEGRGLSKTTMLDALHAYDQYLKDAPEGDLHRKIALRRLADIELELSQVISRRHGLEEYDAALGAEGERNLSIEKSQLLYRDLLRLYPSSANNDEILYHLAHIAEQKGETQRSMGYLTELIREFPKSRYFIEAQFRIAEQAFANGDYQRAEIAYSAVIFSPYRSVFYERSLFKRGWCRYKQQYYYEAVDDYLLAIKVLEMGADKGEFFEAQYDEYYKAVALAFAKHGDLYAIENYFQDEPSEVFLYHIYQRVSLIFLEQARYFDSAMLYTHYLTAHPDSSFHFDAHSQRMKIWQQSGFTGQFIESVESFYLAYRPSDDNASRRQRVAQHDVTPLLEKYGLAIATYYHALTKDKALQENSVFVKNTQRAKQWYQYYVDDFKDSAVVVNAYYQYADLFAQLNQLENAFVFYRKAAYENPHLKHKEAAYALVSLIDEMPTLTDSKGNPWVLSQLKDAEQFCRYFYSDVRAINVAVHVGKKALDAGKISQSIYLLEACRTAGVTLDDDFYILLAEGYFDMADYAAAEKNFSNIQSDYKRESIGNRLALSIFRQGEAAQLDKNNALAIFHFSRIATVAPHSSIAATGLYRAVSLSMAVGQYHEAIRMSEVFRDLFPKNKFTPDVLKTLSDAYLKTEQHLRAADELAAVARITDNDDLKRAALFQAAELYEKQGQLQLAIDNYREYAHSYFRPLDQYMEATYSLSLLYQNIGNINNADFWRRKTVTAGEKFSSELSSDRVQYIVASQALALGNRSQSEFMRYQLVHPLPLNLKRKKYHLQEASRYFKVAARFAFSEIKTEAIYQIGTVYGDFSDALLNSERPSSLTEVELEQYEILLEDQAFPFEDQAIELHENNLRLASKGVSSQWTKRSLAKLGSLYPARYKKEFKVDAVIYDD